MKTSVHEAVTALRAFMANPKSGYAKMPICGKTGLYAASPKWQHLDYNKYRICDIAGNEKLCRLVVTMAKRAYKRATGEDWQERIDNIYL